ETLLRAEQDATSYRVCLAPCAPTFPCVQYWLRCDEHEQDRVGHSAALVTRLQDDLVFTRFARDIGVRRVARAIRCAQRDFIAGRREYGEGVQDRTHRVAEQVAGPRQGLAHDAFGRTTDVDSERLAWINARATVRGAIARAALGRLRAGAAVWQTWRL